MRTKIKIKDKLFDIISCEYEYIMHPMIFEINNIDASFTHDSFQYELEINQYKLILNKMWLQTTELLPHINGSQPTEEIINDISGMRYDDLSIPLKYTGTILAVSDFIREYNGADENAPFQYRTVYECMFENGMLITTIDHSKAMLRIRKNIDLGYRALERRRDRKCIDRFLKSLFVGDYKLWKNSKQKNKYLDKMKSNYKTEQTIQISETITLQED